MEPHLIQDQLIQFNSGTKSIKTDPSNPVVVLSGGAEEPEAVVSVLSQEALLPPGQPGQRHRQHRRSQKQHQGQVPKITS